MSFLKKLFSSERDRPQRVRVCVECGMPTAEHKDWCSIWQHQQALDRKAAATGMAAPERLSGE